VGLSDAQLKQLVEVAGISMLDTLLEAQETDLLICFASINMPSLIPVSHLNGLLHWIGELINVFSDKCVYDELILTPEEYKRFTWLCSNASAERSCNDEGNYNTMRFMVYTRSIWRMTTNMTSTARDYRYNVFKSN
jgi:hypothetical protein